MTFVGSVRHELDVIERMLIEKNKAYGNSALDPVRCFSKADAVEQLKVRIDDKISRLMRGEDAGEDTIRDLIGYLVLLRIAQRMDPPFPFPPRPRNGETEPAPAEVGSAADDRRGIDDDALQDLICSDAINAAVYDLAREGYDGRAIERALALAEDTPAVR